MITSAVARQPLCRARRDRGQGHRALHAAPSASRVHSFPQRDRATHKHPAVMRWLDRHPRFAFHFTPTSCSWINAVEGFFATLTKRRLKRGVFRSVPDLQAAINRFLNEHNEKPKPFLWKANPVRVLAAIQRGKQALERILIRWTHIRHCENS